MSPHPLALYLAARGWQDFHNPIVARLLPIIDESMTERLFQRAADIGDLEVTKDTVGRLLAPGGLYENVDVWGRGGEGMLIVHFAALAPGAVCGRVEAVLAAMSDEDLNDYSHSRPTVKWVLERLAWRTATFRRAAAALLRIAAVTPGANPDHDAAARSWTELFGVRLPTTATRPTTRAQYLGEVARSPDRRYRLLAAAAAGQALVSYEMVTSSADIQGGVLLERRGAPATWGDAFTYMEAAIDVLDVLARDDEPDVADLAISRLVRAIHPFLRVDRIRDYLGGAVAKLPEIGLTATRTEIAHLTALFERVNRDVTDDIESSQTGTGSVRCLASAADTRADAGRLGQHTALGLRRRRASAAADRSRHSPSCRGPCGAVVRHTGSSTKSVLRDWVHPRETRNRR